MKNKPLIVFFGTPDFATPILKILENAEMAPKLIVTSPEKPLNYGSRSSVVRPEKLKDEKFLNQLCALNPDLFVIASYGKILSKEILDIPKYGTLNMHPSLLPKYRGPSPIQSAILNGDKETGVTIMLTDEKMDHGPILANFKLQITNPKITYKELEKELAELGGELLVKTIPDWLSGKIKPKEQNHSKATYTRKIIKEDGLINWSEPAEVIERKIRAYNPWPGAYSFWLKNNKKQRMIFLKAEIVGAPTSDKTSVGKVFETTDGSFAVQTGKGALKIEILKPEGKKEMPTSAFLKGNSEIIGKVLD